MPTSPIRVLLIDDQRLMRAGLHLLIDSKPGLKVVGEAGNRAEALALAASEQPDVILLDLDMGNENGLEFLPELLTVTYGAKVIVLTGLHDQQFHLRAAQLGALGLVLKDQAKETILNAIERVNAGEAWFDGAMVAKALTRMYSNRKSESIDQEAAKLAALTKREREIINLISQGLKNQQIADKLFISEGTVRNHLTAIYAKLEVTDRFGLIIYANRHHLDSHKS